jgi:alpha-L-rhamnosidase
MKKILLLLLISVPMIAFGHPQFSLYDLTCEGAESPLGVENRQPCFSWKIYAAQRNFLQSAYQIIVSGSEEDLAKDAGTLWDSKKVESDKSILVPFAGKALSPASVYYWKVRIWDKEGNASAWSGVQKFTTGLFAEQDWQKARWIAFEQDKKDGRLVPGIHVYDDLKKKLGDKKYGLYTLPQFRKAFTLKKAVKRADAFVAGLGQFDFYLNGKKVGNHFLDAGWTKYDKQALYVAFDVTGMLSNGQNVMGVMLGNGFYNVPNERYFKLTTSYGAPKMRLLLKIEYEDGSVEYVTSNHHWKASPSAITYSSIYGGEDYDATKEQNGWKSSGFDDSRWANALEVSNPITLTWDRTSRASSA